MTIDFNPVAETSLRMAALRDYGIVDTDAEDGFDDIARMASLICQTPIALLSFVEDDRQWFKSEIGVGLRETPIETSICAQAIRQTGVFVVPDARRHPVFKDFAVVTGEPYIRYYAGAPMITPEGVAIGTVCVADRRPRLLGNDQLQAIASLARQVMVQLELRRQLLHSPDAERLRQRLVTIMHPTR